MAIENFKRTESKYLVTPQQYQAMMHALEGRMHLDSYGTTLITSVYYDTPDHSLIERSLEKPLYKEKLRVRWYGNPTHGSRVFVEIKKKFKGTVYKRRTSMTLHAAQAFLRGLPYEISCKRWPIADENHQAESLTYQSTQIAHEIEAFCKRYEGLGPSMQISYLRSAYTPDKDATAVPADLRITFDGALTGTDLRASNAVPFDILNLSMQVMEIKAQGGLPLWLSEVLRTAHIYPCSFSKYGTAYTKLYSQKICNTKKPCALAV